MTTRRRTDATTADTASDTTDSAAGTGESSGGDLTSAPAAPLTPSDTGGTDTGGAHTGGTDTAGTATGATAGASTDAGADATPGATGSGSPLEASAQTAASPLTPPPLPQAAEPQASSIVQPQAAVAGTPGPLQRLEDEHGNDLDVDDLFYPVDPMTGMVVSKHRVSMVSRYQGTSTDVSQLLIAAHVPMAQQRAFRIVHEIKSAIAEGRAPVV